MAALSCMQTLLSTVARLAPGSSLMLVVGHDPIVAETALVFYVQWNFFAVQNTKTGMLSLSLFALLIVDSLKSQ